MSGDTVPARPDELETAAVPSAELVARARAILDAHWRPRGYAVPNTAVYPHQWLWDSCFHAVTWVRLGEPERASEELANVFARQHENGFVPHMTYWDHPDLHASFWGRSGESTITQPPMYGHAVAELVRAGVAIDDDLARRAVAGLEFLLGQRRGSRPLVPIVHPWESGCDDSPRWDPWAGEREPGSWRARKGDLVESLVLVDGASVANPDFEVESAAFNALVAFNARELIDVGYGRSLGPAVDELVSALDARWDPGASTWRDEPSAPGAHPPVRTLEAMLAVLVTDDPARVAAVFAEVADDQAFGGACGPAQVHRGEPAFDPRTYWRGPAWPQLTYLFWVAAGRHGRDDDAAALAAAMVRGVTRSGFAEYWHPDTGEGLGAVPQSWAALVAAMRPRP